MLYYLSDNPWPLAALLGVVAGAFFIALFLTQQGKYLVIAVGTLILAILIIAVEQLWVTDEERIEKVVYALAQGALNSDFIAIDMHLAPEAVITTGDTSLSRQQLTAQVSQLLDETRFDYIHVTGLSTHAGALSRQGTAEFRVHASCTVNTPYGRFNYMTPTSGLDWSLGFRETTPGVWKVSRISPPPSLRITFGFPRR